jgi:hypothetical protein
VDGEVWPVNQFFVDLNARVNAPIQSLLPSTHLFEGLRIVVRQFNFLPHTSGCMRSFDGFDIQVHDACASGQ